jgi:hypothetical protein
VPHSSRLKCILSTSTVGLAPRHGPTMQCCSHGGRSNQRHTDDEEVLVSCGDLAMLHVRALQFRSIHFCCLTWRASDLACVPISPTLRSSAPRIALSTTTDDDAFAAHQTITTATTRYVPINIQPRNQPLGINVESTPSSSSDKDAQPVPTLQVAAPAHRAPNPIAPGAT